MLDDEMEDRSLIDRVRSGDLDAYAKLVDRYRGSVIAYLAVRLPVKTDLEDLVQEVFVTAYRKLDSYEDDNRFGFWLTAIALNHARNYRRKHRPSSVGGDVALEALAGELIEGDARAHDPEIFACLDECLSALPPASLALIRKRYYEGSSINDLAESESRSPSAVKMHLLRARRAIADCLAAALPPRPSPTTSKHGE